jgi:hypothetical protein
LIKKNLLEVIYIKKSNNNLYFKTCKFNLLSFAVAEIVYSVVFIKIKIVQKTEIEIFLKYKSFKNQKW